MKKILLASTILVGTTGFAAAEVTFSGSAYFGIAATMGVDETVYGNINGDTVTTTNATVLNPEIVTSFTAGMMTTTDMGLEAGASLTILGGRATIVNDYGDNEFGMFSNALTGATFGSGSTWGLVLDSSAYLGGDWGRITVAYDSDANDNNTTVGDNDVTFTYSNTWGDFGVSAYYVMTPVNSTATTNGDFGAQIDYSFGDYGVDVSYDYDASDVLPSSNIGVGLTASMNGFTAALNADYDVTNATPITWDASVGYSVNAFTIGASVATDGAGYDYGLTGAYSLGGGVNVTASYMHDNTSGYNVVKAGVAMAF